MFIMVCFMSLIDVKAFPEREVPMHLSEYIDIIRTLGYCLYRRSSGRRSG